MRKIVFTSLVFCFFSTSLFAITPPALTPSPLQLMELRVADFLRLSTKEIEKRTGKKFSPGEKRSPSRSPGRK